jgi:DNA-binding PadR family transcriptional regulator
MKANPGASLGVLAEAAGWRMKTGQPYKMRAQRTLKALEKDKLVKAERRVWKLTEKGREEAERVQTNIEHVGARYG